MNSAAPSQSVEPPQQANDEDLVGMVRRLVDCLRLSGGFSVFRSGNHDLTIANHALDAAKSAEELVARLRGRINELELLAETDELTGLLNRRGFDNQLQRIISGVRRYNEQGVLIYIDLDDFKLVNDTFGHAAGDEVLRRVAGILRHGIRETDFAGRLGGDEFAVLLSRTNWENGLSRAERLEKQLNDTVVQWRDRMIEVNASFGLQGYGHSKDEDNHEEGLDLLRRADEAMYKTKRLRNELGGDPRDDRQAGP